MSRGRGPSGSWGLVALLVFVVLPVLAYVCGPDVFDQLLGWIFG